MITPALDGTILPGVTRESCLSLIDAHSSVSNTFIMPHLPATLRLHAIEGTITMSDLERWASHGTLLEIFCTGTAVTVASVGRIGLDRVPDGPESQKYQDLVWPESKWMGPIAKGLLEALAAIQTGKLQMDDWSVVCT